MLWTFSSSVLHALDTTLLILTSQTKCNVQKIPPTPHPTLLNLSKHLLRTRKHLQHAKCWNERTQRFDGKTDVRLGAVTPKTCISL